MALPFQSIDGGTKAKKVFVLDPKLLGPLGLLIEPDFLKVREFPPSYMSFSSNCLTNSIFPRQAQGMEKLFVLGPTRIEVTSDVRHVVYIVRPQYVQSYLIPFRPIEHSF